MIGCAKQKRFFALCVALCATLCLSFSTAGRSAAYSQEYGVFLGIGAEEANRLEDCRLVVIEPSEFQADQVAKLHDAGKTVYGYINIGAIEEYRPYYGRFKGATLAVYENWPDERWVDVSSSAWQDFIVHELGKRYARMGFDGFFLDNADVYDHYQTDDVFNGLCTIVKGLKGYGLSLVINGGDRFVSRCMEEGTALSLFDGVNQETVFTSINFENSTYGVQQEAETAYYQEYLKKAKGCGLSVYLLEYGADRALSKRIDAYCREHGFLWYNADGVELR